MTTPPAPHAAAEALPAKVSVSPIVPLVPTNVTVPPSGQLALSVSAGLPAPKSAWLAARASATTAASNASWGSLLESPEPEHAMRMMKRARGRRMLPCSRRLPEGSSHGASLTAARRRRRHVTVGGAGRSGMHRRPWPDLAAHRHRFPGGIGAATDVRGNVAVFDHLLRLGAQTGFPGDDAFERLTQLLRAARNSMSWSTVLVGACIEASWSFSLAEMP